MTPSDYVKAIKRRWFDVVLAVMVAAGIGYGLSAVAPAGPQTQTYEATAVLLASGDFYTPGTSLEALAELTTVGEVPIRAAEEVGYEGEPLDLAAGIEVSADREAGILRITSTSTLAREAEQHSNAFAEALQGFLQDTRAGTLTERREELTLELDEMTKAISALQRRIAEAEPAKAEALQPDLQALLNDKQFTLDALYQLASPESVPSTLDLVQPGVAIPVDAGGIRPPDSRLSRVILAAILGLISGILIVLLADRFDTRIRTKQAAERDFALPVLADIPFISRLKRKARSLAIEDEPRSNAADSFRMLATMLSMPEASGVERLPMTGNGNGSGNGAADAADRSAEDAVAPRTTGGPPKTILITSPGPSDGKTTIAANLAVAFGQLGKRVIVLSCDLRRPSIHRLFDVENDEGIADRLDSSATEKILRGSVRETKFPNVWVVPSGPPPNAPGRLLASPQMRRALDEAREAADVTIIDTAPILTTSDAANLMPHVDAIVLIARAGRTTADVARQTAQLVARLGGRVRGVVLNAAVESSVPRRYYYYRYYRARPKPEKSAKGSPRLSRHSAEP